jgi:MYXO-CTERM domain-containing protein
VSTDNNNGTGQDQQDKAQPSVEQLEAELVEQRRQLGETVDQLSQKMDVKSRARDAKDRAIDKATDDDGRPTPQTYAALGVVAAAVVGFVVLRLRRRRG